MGTKHVTDHHDGDDHTRTIVYRDSDGDVTRIVEQKVADTPIGELGATNTSETRFDSHGNSYTSRK
jgi:hypothetical protein